MRNSDKLNAHQATRVIEIIKIAKEINNYVDCDVIQDAIETLAHDSTVNLNMTMGAIDYLMGAICFRTKETPELKKIEKMKKQIRAFISLQYAYAEGYKPAIDWFNEQMEIPGNQTRII